MWLIRITYSKHEDVFNIVTSNKFVFCYAIFGLIFFTKCRYEANIILLKVIQAETVK